MNLKITGITLCAAICCSCGNDPQMIERRALENGTIRLLPDDQFEIRVFNRNSEHEIEISSSKHDVLGCLYGTSGEGKGAWEIDRIAGAPFESGFLKTPKKLVFPANSQMEKLIYVDVITEDGRVVWESGE